MKRTTSLLCLLVSVAAFADPWARPDDVTEYTDPLKAIWDTAPVYDGTVLQDWTGIPLEDGANILCIGNSLSGWGSPLNDNLEAVYSYFNSGKSIRATLMGRGSAWIRDYIDEEADLHILDSIRSGRYDIVIVQPWQDAMWPRSIWDIEAQNTNLDSLMSHFVGPMDSLYRECSQAGSQMVVWSPNGSQFDDRYVYMAYAPYNCQRLAKRLNIPYAFTCEAFDSCYTVSDTNSQFVWYDAVHESTEMSAMYSTLIYSMLMGGTPLDGLPANWLDIPGTNWSTSYSESNPRTEFIRQDLLTQYALYFDGVQASFNTGAVSVGALRSTPLHALRIAQPAARGVVTLSGRSAFAPALCPGQYVRVLRTGGRASLSLRYQSPSQ